MNEIDIKRAARSALPVFERENWYYYDAVPDQRRLEETISYLIGRVEEMAEENPEDLHVSCATGRFYVEYTRYDDLPEISVKLELASSFD